MSDRSSQTNNRRTTLKALAAATGAATISTLPSVWRKPIVRVGAVPAFAQTSTLLSIRLDWANLNLDYDLVVVDPDNTFAGYDPTAAIKMNFNAVSTTLAHSGDTMNISPGSETVTQMAPLQSGTYTIVLIGHLFVYPSFSITVTYNGVSTVIDNGSYGPWIGASYRYIATISIPDGTVDDSVYNTPYP